MKQRWDFALRSYYGKRAKKPKIPGKLALETVHLGEASRDMEISAGRSRDDIGLIFMRDLRSDGPWEPVYAEMPDGAGGA